jgi:pimeloyl-ACP methyl ester carboxylesterase
MTTFVLVHGANHGAWCWDRLAPALRERGHTAIAVDLPCEDPAAGASAYAEVVIDALPESPDIVLVGHSLGGATIPLVAVRRQVRRLIFLCAIVPVPGRALFEREPDAPSPIAAGFRADDIGDGTVAVPPEIASRFFYNRCRPDDAQWAISRLRRQGRLPLREASPLKVWPSVPRTYILCSDDQVVLPDAARWQAQIRAGVDPIVLDADHSPFLSNVPGLVEILVTSAKDTRAS